MDGKIVGAIGASGGTSDQDGVTGKGWRGFGEVGSFKIPLPGERVPFQPPG